MRKDRERLMETLEDFLADAGAEPNLKLVQECADYIMSDIRLGIIGPDEYEYGYATRAKLECDENDAVHPSHIVSLEEARRAALDDYDGEFIPEILRWRVVRRKKVAPNPWKEVF